MPDTGFLSYCATPINLGKRSALLANQFSRLNAYLLAEAERIVLITMQSVVVSQMKNRTCKLPSEQTLRLPV